jgi:hypothetical protein
LQILQISILVVVLDLSYNLYSDVNFELLFDFLQLRATTESMARRQCYGLSLKAFEAQRLRASDESTVGHISSMRS